MVIVVGAGGEESFEKSFRNSATRLRKIAIEQKMNCQVVGFDLDAEKFSKEPSLEKSKSSTSDLKQLAQIIAAESKFESAAPIWIVMFGHGTFDGKKAKFNLRGEDLDAQTLNQWLETIERPTIVVNCASSSAPFIHHLSRKGRIVVTATKSGYEMNATRFGAHFVSAFESLDADIDKDNQVSLLEAFLYASGQVENWYESEGRLLSEHALIDDNADRKGTSRDFFRGVHVVKKAKDSSELPDGPFSNQWYLVPSEEEAELSDAFRAERNAIELKIEKIRLTKSSLSEDEYLALIEPELLAIAQLYASLESKPNSEQEPESNTDLEADSSGSDN